MRGLIKSMYLYNKIRKNERKNYLFGIGVSAVLP